MSPTFLIGNCFCLCAASLAFASSGRSADDSWVDSHTQAEDENTVAEQLGMAAKDGNLSAVETLLRDVRDINETDSRGYTALHWAVVGNHERIIRILLRAGADIEARGPEEMTPLHLAALFGQRQAAGVLFEMGASLSALDKRGHTAFQLLDEDVDATRIFATSLGIELDPPSLERNRQFIARILTLDVGPMEIRPRSSRSNTTTYVIGGCLLLMFLGIVIGYRAKRKRARAMHKVAREIGASFAEQKHGWIESLQKKHSVLSGGDIRSVRNIISGATDGASFSVFDFECTVPGVSSSYRYTMICVESGTLNCPDFLMLPKGFVGRLADATGLGDLTIPDQVFNNEYAVEGESDDLHRFFSPDVTQFFSDRKGMILQACSKSFVLHYGITLKPEQIPEALRAARSVYHMLSTGDFGQ